MADKKTDPMRDAMLERAIKQAPPVPVGRPLPVDQPGFRQWYTDWATRERMNPNPDALGQDYDYRAAHQRGVTPPRTSEGEHWPSDDKEQGHPNLVVGGFDTKTGDRVPGTRRETSVEKLVEAGWDRETAQQLVRKPEPK